MLLKLIASLLALVSAEPITWSFTPNRENDVVVQQTDDELTIMTTGHDPYIVGKWPEKLLPQHRVLEFQYFCPAGIEDLSIFPGPPFQASTEIQLPPMRIAETWATYRAVIPEGAGLHRLSDSPELRIDLGMKPDVRLKIRDIRIHPLSADDAARQEENKKNWESLVERGETIRGYLDATFPLSLEEVIVEAEQIRLVGKRAARLSTPARWQVIELAPGLDVDADGVAVRAELEVDEENFEFVVPRFDQQRDRCFSGWRIIDGRPLTARQFPTRFGSSPSLRQSPPTLPRSQKGLGGFWLGGPVDEVADLGVSAVTLNVVLNHFISSSAGPRRERLPVEGPPVYFDSTPFDQLDQTMAFAEQHDLIVSAILLILPRHVQDQKHPLVHPKNDAGSYSMPDLTTDRGAMIYAQVLQRIASRYDGMEGSPGLISNWIAHNEVDFHHVWSNMGIQPRPIVTETYYRAMRIIHTATVQSVPTARVFASLTHHWNVPDDGAGKQLAPRDFLLDLQRYCQQEGDFSWGVAYHPYPENLFATLAWEDRNITDDFDSPLITMKNFDVLVRFLKQTSMLDSQGGIRPILLSEQGTHSASYSDEDQAWQAGSLWWMMQQVRKYPQIESFHYHRWIDHPSEGGLLLGLRTLPTADHPHGQRKRAWYVYQAIGTDREQEVTEGLPRPQTP